MTYLNLNPSNHRNLYSFDKSFLKLTNLYKKNNLPNKIMFCGNKGIGKATLSYHLINFIFSNNEELKYNLNNFEINEFNKSYNLVNNNSHPNFFLIKKNIDNKQIEISQVRNMINFANKSSFNNKEKIILIDGVEDLSINSLNALLKVIEEPNDNVFFILILDNNKNVSSTLLSRCIKFNLNMTSDECLQTTNKIIKNNLVDLINSDLLHYYNTPGDFLNLLNFSKNKKIDILKLNLKDLIKILIETTDYKKDLDSQKNISKFIELYFTNLIKQNASKKINILYSEFIRKIYNVKKFNLDFESLIIEFKTKVLNE